jgi:cytochrome c-type biogenesis protein CcmH/NrfF
MRLALQAAFGLFCIGSMPYAGRYLTISHWSVWLPVLVLVMGGTVILASACRSALEAWESRERAQQEEHGR